MENALCQVHIKELGVPDGEKNKLKRSDFAGVIGLDITFTGYYSKDGCEEA